MRALNDPREGIAPRDPVRVSAARAPCESDTPADDRLGPRADGPASGKLQPFLRVLLRALAAWGV